MLISLTKQETKTEYDKEEITIKKFGRSHKVFDDLIEQFSQKTEEDKNKTEIYCYDSYWQFVNKQPKRDLSTIFIEEEKLELIKKAIADFDEKEDWYIEHGIPYQFGMLLHGPPGTGKTSLIRALAAYTDRSISIIRTRDITKLEEVFQSLKENTIVVIEDIDSSGFTFPRDEDEDYEDDEEPIAERHDGKIALEKIFKGEKKKKDTPSGSQFERIISNMNNIGLSELLNAIDGVISTHGRMLIMTTNFPENLDKALLRPGRIDLKLEIGYVNKELFDKFMLKFYPDMPKEVLNNVRLIDKKLTGAILQGNLLEGYSYTDILKKYTDY